MPDDDDNPALTKDDGSVVTSDEDEDNSADSSRGYALLVCNVKFKRDPGVGLSEREGQLKDLKAFKKMLKKKFGFEVDLKTNQSKKDMEELMKNGGW